MSILGMVIQVGLTLYLGGVVVMVLFGSLGVLPTDTKPFDYWNDEHLCAYVSLLWPIGIVFGWSRLYEPYAQRKLHHRELKSIERELDKELGL